MGRATFSSVVLCSQGDVVLPLPSIEVLAEVAGSQARTTIVVHVLESFVVKLIKVCMSGSCDDNDHVTIVMLTTKFIDIYLFTKHK